MRPSVPQTGVQATQRAGAGAPAASRPPQKLPGGSGGQGCSTKLTCYECGQVGHIKPNCPQWKNKPCIAGARLEEVVEHSGSAQEGEEEPQSSKLDEQMDVQGDHESEIGELVTDYQSELMPYQWDDDDDTWYISNFNSF
ncbi:hypothetical protein K439DRAFT_1617036 [Ramaria rubella]|nr:hypothetical protein K439DRAFT_1617036 [Ramaria rubella]